MQKSGSKILVQKSNSNQSKQPTKNPNQIFQIYINCCPIYLFIIKLILKRFKEVKWVNLYIYTKNIFELKFAMLKSILTAFYYYCYPTTFLKQLFFNLYPKKYISFKSKHLLNSVLKVTQTPYRGVCFRFHLNILTRKRMI